MKPYSTQFNLNQTTGTALKNNCSVFRMMHRAAVNCLMVLVLMLSGQKIFAQNSLSTDYFRSITSGNWNAAGTWESSPVSDFSSGVVNPATLSPDNNAATITITSGNTVTVTASLATDETIVQSGATLVENSDLIVSDGTGTDLDVNGTFNFTSGTLSGAGSVSINSGASFNWSGYIMQGSGTTTIASGATANITGSVYTQESRTIINNSTSFSLLGNLHISGSPSVFINNGYIDIPGDGGLPSNGGSGNIINNNGTITKSGGSGTSNLSNASSITFNNSGTVNVNSGIVSLGGSGTHSGSFTVAGGTLRFASGVHTLTASTSFTGSGNVNFSGGTITFPTGSSYASTLATIESGADVDWNISPSIASYTLTSGNMQGSGIVTITTFNWSGGVMKGSGTTTIAGGKTATITGSVNIQETRTLINNSAGFSLQGNMHVAGTPALFINNGTIDIPGDGSLPYNGGSGNIINNNGTITKSGGSGTSYLSNTAAFITFNNYGAVNVNSGTIRIESNGTNAGTYNIAVGNTLTGNVQPFTGLSINNNGNITLNALTFNGTSVQSLNGIGKINYLTIDNANGVTLRGNQTINNALTLTSGVVSTGVNKLIVGSAATIARTNGWVNSNLELPFSNSQLSKTFFIGDATNYTEVQLSFNSISGSGSVLGSQTIGIHPNLGLSTISRSKRVNRYYSLNPSGFTFGNYDAIFNFIAGDVLNSANTDNFIVGKFNPTTWTYPTVGNKTTTSTQITGVTSFSDFQIGEPCLAPTISIHPLATQTICKNTPSSNLTVTATGDGLTYQWYVDNNNSGFDGSSIASAINSSFTPPTGTAGTLFYYVLVTGDCGSATSNYASVTVSPLFTWYRDADSDGFGALNNLTTTCSSTAPAGYVSNSTDCDDTKATYADNDGDGFGAGPKTPCGVGNNTDCNDTNWAINPGAAEICGNGIDDNCNGLIDENCTGCSNATDTSTSNITSSSATLNWKAKANPTQWQVQYKTTKIGSMWVDVFATGDKRSITLLNLAAKQDYKWNIRAKCGNKWLSYTESIGFRTLAGTAASRMVISTEEKPFKIITYPNPTNGNFKIAVKGLENKLTSNVLVEIENGYGQLVYSKRVENINGIIDVTMDRKVAAGIYLVHCIVNGTNVTKKIVIGREL